MKILIKDKNGKELGILSVVGKKVIFENISDDEFAGFVRAGVERGLPILLRKNRNLETCTTYKAVMNPDSPDLLIIERFLRNNGYIVEEVGSNRMANELEEILKNVPDNNSDKRLILDKFPKLNSLRQAQILKILKDAGS